MADKKHPRNPAFVFGPLAARPNASGLPDRFVYFSDEGGVYRVFNDAWVVVKAPPFTSVIGSAGAGTLNVVHNYGTTDVDVIVRRIAVPAGTTFPLGIVSIRWVPTDTNTVQLDFDTYARTANEFSVTVERL